MSHQFDSRNKREHIDVQLVSMTAEHMSNVMSISYVELGSDYLTEEEFTGFIESDEDFVITALHDGVPVGFIINNVFGSERVDEILRLPDSPERDEMMECGCVGYLSALAILDEYKGCGIGTKLIVASMDVFKERGVKIACGMAWKNVQNGITNVKTIFDRMGFESSLEIQGYWNDPRKFPEGHDCPVCGRPCRCYGVLYSRRI